MGGPGKEHTIVISNFGVEPPCSDTKRIIQTIISQRDSSNKNNILRTAAYRGIFRRNPELPWSFLAHLVSRNAGYTMTDLKRTDLLDAILLIPSLFTSFPAASTVSAGLFRFLERGNFLIFFDAFPQLRIYESSKRCPDISTVLFDSLINTFGVQKFTVQKWKEFFKIAKANNFFRGEKIEDIPKLNPIKDMSLTLIANEQTFIEFRLVKNPKFTKFANIDIPTIISALEGLDAARLCFPYPATPDKMKVFVVKDFDKLDSRFGTGISLYENVIKSTEFNMILDFASGSSHGGSRTDYNDNGYSKSRSAQLPFGKKFSPDLISAWGDDATKFDSTLADVHDPPGEAGPGGTVFDFEPEMKRLLGSAPPSLKQISPDPPVNEMKEILF